MTRRIRCVRPKSIVLVTPSRWVRRSYFRWPPHVVNSYGPLPERGIYRTANGGQSWTRVLLAGDSAGGIDVLLDPIPRLQVLSR